MFWSQAPNIIHVYFSLYKNTVLSGGFFRQSQNFQKWGNLYLLCLRQSFFFFLRFKKFPIENEIQDKIFAYSNFCDLKEIAGKNPPKINGYAVYTLYLQCNKIQGTHSRQLGFIQNCHISCNFCSKILRFFFCDHSRLPIGPSTPNLTTTSIKTIAASRTFPAKLVFSRVLFLKIHSELYQMLWYTLTCNFIFSCTFLQLTFIQRKHFVSI